MIYYACHYVGFSWKIPLNGVTSTIAAGGPSHVTNRGGGDRSYACLATGGVSNEYVSDHCIPAYPERLRRWRP